MDKIAMYKEEIFKEAGVNMDLKTNRVYLDGDDYEEFLNINPKIKESSQQKAWNSAKSDVDNFLNKHPKKELLRNEAIHNEKRRSAEHPRAKRAFSTRATAIPLMTGVVGAGIGGLKTSGSKKGKVIGGLKGTAVGILPGLVSGTIAYEGKNERFRNEKFGKPKYRVHDEINKDVYKAFKDKKYGY